MNVQWSTSRRHISLAPQILAILLLILVLSPADAVLAEDNLIANPGFEEGSENEVADWASFGDVQWVTDEVHSGSRAMKVHAEGDSSVIKSSFFEVPVHARVEVSAWLKAQDVVSPGSYFKLRMTLYAYEADQTRKIKHWDLVSTVGSFEWKQVRASVIVPPDTKYMHLAVQLTKSSGTVWVDDVAVKIAQTMPDAPAASNGSEMPIVIPQPWQMRSSKNTLTLGTIGILSNKTDNTLKEAISSYFKVQGLSFLFVSPNDPIASFKTILILGDESQPAVDERFRTLFEGLSWSDLGQEGYFLSVTPRTNNDVTIYLAANSEQGKFYGLQTLKQLIFDNNQENNQGDKHIYVADIVDRPTLSRRGIPVGIQWYRQQPELFKRLGQLKLNFVWNQGTFQNQKFLYRWREPLTERESKTLQHYLILARKHFITPYIAIAPRGRNLSEATSYSSETDINLLVDKIVHLYDLGVRHVGLTFDDLGNSGQHVLVGEDVAFFNNNIGKAHYYFVEEVHKRLIAIHPDINLMVIPMIYHDLGSRGDTELSYLTTLAQLSPEIEMYSSAIYPEDALMTKDLTNRKPLIWDNFWATSYQTHSAPEFIVPLDRSKRFDHSLVTGFTFLPLIPALEDASWLSWRTAADYAWAPERYDSDISFQLARSQYLKETDQVPEADIIIETPSIRPSSGTFLDSVTVELKIKTTTANSTIRYTLDGSTPTSSSKQYKKPFTLTDSTRVKAKVFDQESNKSGIVSAFFAVYPVKSRVYLPIVDLQPLDTGVNCSSLDDCPDDVGFFSWVEWLRAGILFILTGISLLIWRARSKLNN